MRQRDRVFTILSLVLLGLTVVVLVFYALIAMDPYLPLNPFPPRSEVVVVATVTPSPTVTHTPVATWTSTATPTITPTPPPSFTPTITPTPEDTSTPVPTETPEPTAAPTPRVTRSPYPFTYQVTYETPYYGCAWTGVAGTVEDIDGNPLIGYPVHVWGGGIDTVVTSGDKQIYGDSGWEQFFNNAPQEIRGVFRVQLHSRDNPNHPPVSQEIVLDFPGYCSTALARIVFILNH
jgi:hypothetical protein